MLRARHLSQITLCVAVLCGVPFCTVAQDTATTGATAVPGVATGQRIGNIVKAAITTAFPAVSTVLNAILGATPNSSGSKVSKTDLAQGATAANVQVAKDVQVKAAQAIAPVGQVGSELATVNLFLAPTVAANDDVLTMQVELAAAAPDWSAVAVNWKVAKAQLGQISKIQDADINKVGDLYLRGKLSDIKSSNNDLVIRVDAAITSKDVSHAEPLLEKLAIVLGGMPAVAGYELANLQADLTSLASWAKGAGGSPSSPSSLHVYTTILDSIHTP